MSSIITQNTIDSKFRSILKPTKLLWRNNKTTPIMTPIGNEDKQVVKEIKEESGEEDGYHHHTIVQKNHKSFIPTPTIGSLTLKIKNPKIFSESSSTASSEIYELSTVDEEGVYRTPDINSSIKYDHDLNNDDTMFPFFVPSQDCLITRSSGQHSFFTPSSTLMVSV